MSVRALSLVAPRISLAAMKPDRRPSIRLSASLQLQRAPGETETLSATLLEWWSHGSKFATVVEGGDWRERQVRGAPQTSEKGFAVLC